MTYSRCLTKEMRTLVVLIPMFGDTPARGLGFSCHWPNAVLALSESKKSTKYCLKWVITFSKIYTYIVLLSFVYVFHVEMREQLSRSIVLSLLLVKPSLLFELFYVLQASLLMSFWVILLFLLPISRQDARTTNAGRALAFLCQFQGLNSSYRAPCLQACSVTEPSCCYDMSTRQNWIPSKS